MTSEIDAPIRATSTRPPIPIARRRGGPLPLPLPGAISPLNSDAEDSEAGALESRRAQVWRDGNHMGTTTGISNRGSPSEEANSLLNRHTSTIGHGEEGAPTQEQQGGMRTQAKRDDHATTVDHEDPGQEQEEARGTTGPTAAGAAQEDSSTTGGQGQKQVEVVPSRTSEWSDHQTFETVFGGDGAPTSPEAPQEDQFREKLMIQTAKGLLQQADVDLQEAGGDKSSSTTAPPTPKTQKCSLLSVLDDIISRERDEDSSRSGPGSPLRASLEGVMLALSAVEEEPVAPVEEEDKVLGRERDADVVAVINLQEATSSPSSSGSGSSVGTRPKTTAAGVSRPGSSVTTPAQSRVATFVWRLFSAPWLTSVLPRRDIEDLRLSSTVIFIRGEVCSCLRRRG